MDEIINTLFPKVLAQSSDAIAQPPFGEITGTDGGGTTSTVLINWENPSLKVGDRFKVRIELDSLVLILLTAMSLSISCINSELATTLKHSLATLHKCW